ncbi:SDR family NAD(P)-dependent oxidoreductase [Actinosynnema sp. CA-299493]
MITAGKAVLVTGANRGIGKALVDEALRRGARRVYAGTRQPLEHPDDRVTPVTLDVTDPAHIQAAVERVDALDLLINNAGVAAVDDLTDTTVLDRMLAVNLYGAHHVTQAFLPLLTESAGAIATNMSLTAIAPYPLAASYSISKAAVLAMTQSLRAILASRGVRVHAILTGPADTDMGVRFDVLPRTPPELVAHNVFEGVEDDVEDIFPDPMSQDMADAWHNGSTKGFERRLAEMYAQRT